MDKHKDNQPLIVVPERVSVKDLRAWLTNFGKANQQHYEKGQLLMKQQQAAIQSRIQSLEDNLGSPSSASTVFVQSSGSDSSQVPAGQTTWESPTKSSSSSSSTDRGNTTPDSSSNSSTQDDVVVVDTRGSPSPQKTDNSPVIEEKRDESERQPPVVVQTTSRKPKPELDSSTETTNPSINVKKQWHSIKGQSKSGSPTMVPSARVVRTSSKTKKIDPTFSRSHVNHSSTRALSRSPKTISPTSKVYRFEPVRQRPRMRVVGVERLLEPPVPSQRRPTSTTWWDDNEDEWADDFSEPCFPQAPPACIAGARPSSTVPKATRMAPNKAEWKGDWKMEESRGYSVDDAYSDNEDEDDSSFLESVSLGTGRYTDPGHRRPKSRKNRFPLWLCHKRKPGAPFDQDGVIVEYHKDTELGYTTSTGKLYESPPRPLPNDMYKAAFFPDGVLTKSTLDLLCQQKDDEEEVCSLPSRIPVTAPFKKNVAAQENLTSPSRSQASSNQSTSTSGSSSAILPGAIPNQVHNALERDRRRVATAINQWGGRRQATSQRTANVAQRRRQLEQAMERGRPVSHVKRIQWQVCPKTGLYKKKIVVESKKGY